jgi:hypothetical protein
MKAKNILVLITIFFSQISYGNEEIISSLSRVIGKGFNDDYYEVKSGEWSSYINMNDAFPILYLENKNYKIKIATDAYSDGGKEPTILKIEDALICGAPAVIVSTSEILGVNSPKFLYYRYIYINTDNQYEFFNVVLDDASTKAGGLLPSAISSTINDPKLCLKQ